MEGSIGQSLNDIGFSGQRTLCQRVALKHRHQSGVFSGVSIGSIDLAPIGGLYDQWDEITIYPLILNIYLLITSIKHMIDGFFHHIKHRLWGSVYPEFVYSFFRITCPWPQKMNSAAPD